MKYSSLHKRESGRWHNFALQEAKKSGAAYELPVFSRNTNSFEIGPNIKQRLHEGLRYVGMHNVRALMHCQSKQDSHSC